MNGCKLTITKKLGAVTTALKATVDVAGCTAGKSIEVIAPGCTITVPQQTNLSSLTFTNNAGPPKDVNVTISLQGITYQFDNAGLCPAAGGVTTHNADLTGTATFKAFEDVGTEAAQHTSGSGATHRVHQYNRLTCGAQVDLIAT